MDRNGGSGGRGQPTQAGYRVDEVLPVSPLTVNTPPRCPVRRSRPTSWSRRRSPSMSHRSPPWSGRDNHRGEDIMDAAQFPTAEAHGPSRQMSPRSRDGGVDNTARPRHHDDQGCQPRRRRRLTFSGPATTSSPWDPSWLHGPTSTCPTGSRVCQGQSTGTIEFRVNWPSSNLAQTVQLAYPSKSSHRRRHQLPQHFVGAAAHLGQLHVAPPLTQRRLVHQIGRSHRRCMQLREDLFTQPRRSDLDGGRRAGRAGPARRSRLRLKRSRSTRAYRSAIRMRSA